MAERPPDPNIILNRHVAIPSPIREASPFDSDHEATMADATADDQTRDELREARRQCAEAEQLAKFQAVALAKIRAMANDALGVSAGASDAPTPLKAVCNLDQAHTALCQLRTEIEHFVHRVAPILAVTTNQRG